MRVITNHLNEPGPSYPSAHPSLKAWKKKIIKGSAAYLEGYQIWALADASYGSAAAFKFT